MEFHLVHASPIELFNVFFMMNQLSNVGIFHTAISIIAVLLAFYALLQDGRILPGSKIGKLYIAFTVVACVSSFPIMRMGVPTGGHFIGILVLILLPLAIYAKRLFGTRSVYIQTIAMSTTLFLSLIPAVVETLTRVPASKPFAESQESTVVTAALTILFVLYIGGIYYQIMRLRWTNKMVH